ncbi:uncharacterized protein LOC119114346 [Pollicipes pollicipes]|uniref:uncharacterized protein LOC119114346 n=1 Tax=Pollicipes pollicipes TaxID=41117 RepID=UPI001884D259|nr:uncharacterized protein LOC119114346 [Pollicipes pollicipes]
MVIDINASSPSMTPPHAAERPLSAAAWRQEVKAVVADIAPQVASAAPSSLPADAGGALLNITTLEGRCVTVRLSAGGFAVCGEGHDADDGGDGRLFETPYALLHSVSPGFTAAFGLQLAERLGRLGAAPAPSQQGSVDDQEVAVDGSRAVTARATDGARAAAEHAPDGLDGADGLDSAGQSRCGRL